MNTNMLTLASRLSDQDFVARTGVLAGKEREASVELVAHLAALETRPSLYAGQSYGSLFGYCTQVLLLSEDAACNRIEAARACLSFPVILDPRASGAMSLTSVRLLRGHLTPENHVAVLAWACGKRRREFEALVAELAPRPDVPPSIRKLPTSAPPPLPATTSGAEPSLPIAGPPPALPARRPIVQTTSPERYRVQFTIAKESHDKLRRLQALLRREIPDGDPGAIFDRAASLLLERIEKTKLGAARNPRGPRAIRSGTDSRKRASRYIPPNVKRAVWERDQGQCTFAAADGRRCTERAFLEYHHLELYARGGPATVENIALRCSRHNHYEGELTF